MNPEPMPADAGRIRSAMDGLRFAILLEAPDPVAFAEIEALGKMEVRLMEAIHPRPMRVAGAVAL